MTTPRPMGDYAAIRVEAGFFVSPGITPRVNGVLQHLGRIGAELAWEDTERAARFATDILIRVADGAIRTTVEPLSLTAYLACEPSFIEPVGMWSLPGGAPIELVLTGNFDPELPLAVTATKRPTGRTSGHNLGANPRALTIEPN